MGSTDTKKVRKGSKNRKGSKDSKGPKGLKGPKTSKSNKTKVKSSKGKKTMKGGYDYNDDDDEGEKTGTEMGPIRYIADDEYSLKYYKYKAKYLKLRAKQFQNGGGEDENIKDYSSDLSNWIYQEGSVINDTEVKGGPVKYYSKMVEKYGKPTYLVNQKHGVAKWINGETEKDISPHDVIMLKDEYVEHTKPRPHRDFMYSIVKVYVPPERLVDIIKISGSINYDPLMKHLRARCASFAANFATFKTVFQVLETGEETDYGENIDEKEEKEQTNEEYVKEQVTKNQKKYAKELAQPFYELDRV